MERLLRFLVLLPVLALAAAAPRPARAGELRVAWEAVPGSLVAGYDVELLDADGVLLRVLDVGTERTVLLTGLRDGRVYRVRVRPYDRFGNRARTPSAELTSLPAPRIDEVDGALTAGRPSWVSLHGANFADGAEVFVRRRGVRVLEATVVRHDLLVLELSSPVDAPLEPADFSVVNPVPKAAPFFDAHPETLDLDGSGSLDPGDLSPLEAFFGVTRDDPRYRLRWDPNGDGVIDGEDRALLENRLAHRDDAKGGENAP